MRKNPVKYFMDRAKEYNFSSRWVADAVLIKKLRELSGANPEAKVLDIAIGTGKIAQAFQGWVKCVVGVDICWEMVRQARHCVDYIVLAPAEKLPLRNDIFDICVCRQGLQFMDLGGVLGEIHRVLKPGGRIVLCHLTAYGEKDKEESFLIQKFRNPARKNFFLPEDIPCLLKNQAFKDIEYFDYISRESVNQWIDNAAISKNAKERVKQIYRDASFDFKRIHSIEFKEEDILDSMKMIIARARKGTGNV